MPLPSSGAISLNSIHVEAGGTSASMASLNDSDIRSMIGKSSGASNSFSEYYGISNTEPNVDYVGRIYTTGNGFPAGNANFSSGTKVIVVCMELATTEAVSANTYCNISGIGNLSLAARLKAGNPGGDVAVYYVETSVSGTRYVSGNGGGGRSVIDIYEITSDYNSATPTATATATTNSNPSQSGSITVNGDYNGVTFIAGRGHYGDNTVSPTTDITMNQIKLEIATSHFSIVDNSTPNGNQTYTVTSDETVRAQAYNAYNGVWVMAAANFK